MVVGIYSEAFSENGREIMREALSVTIWLFVKTANCLRKLIMSRKMGKYKPIFFELHQESDAGHLKRQQQNLQITAFQSDILIGVHAHKTAQQLYQ